MLKKLISHLILIWVNVKLNFKTLNFRWSEKLCSTNLNSFLDLIISPDTAVKASPRDTIINNMLYSS